MSNFKVGQRVTIKTDEEIRRELGVDPATVDPVVPSMLELLGKSGVVDSIESNGHITVDIPDEPLYIWPASFLRRQRFRPHPALSVENTDAEALACDCETCQPTVEPVVDYDEALISAFSRGYFAGQATERMQQAIELLEAANITTLEEVDRIVRLIEAAEFSARAIHDTFPDDIPF